MLLLLLLQMALSSFYSITSSRIPTHQHTTHSHAHLSDLQTPSFSLLMRMTSQAHNKTFAVKLDTVQFDWSSLTFSTRISERKAIHSLLFDTLMRFGSRRSSDHRAVTPCSRFHRQSRSWRLRLADWHRANHDLCRDAHFRSRTGTRHDKLKNRTLFRTYFKTTHRLKRLKPWRSSWRRCFCSLLPSATLARAELKLSGQPSE